MYVIQIVKKDGSRAYLVRSKSCGYLPVPNKSFATKFNTFSEATIVNMDAARKMDASCKVVSTHG